MAGQHCSCLRSKPWQFKNGIRPVLRLHCPQKPSYGYTVRKKDALQVDEYQKEGNKVKYIRATDIYTPFLVGAEAGYLISGVNDPNYDPKKDNGGTNDTTEVQG